MFPVRERNQIRVVVCAFSDNCAGCWPVTKTHDDVMRNHARHTWQRNRADTRIEQITRTELVQQCGTEGVDEANLKIGSGEDAWIGATSAGASTILVGGSEPIELTEEAIVLPELVVHPK